jgi:hypothetical protein
MKISIIQNMGMLDRIFRICLGMALVVFGILIVKGAIGILLVVLSIPLVVSAIVGFYPGYVPLGISTKRRKTCC